MEKEVAKILARKGLRDATLVQAEIKNVMKQREQELKPVFIRV